MQARYFTYKNGKLLIDGVFYSFRIRMGMLYAIELKKKHLIENQFFMFF